MEAVCARSDSACQIYTLAAVLHSLHLYCAFISAALIFYCAPKQPLWCGKSWRGQNVRGIASLVLAATWCCNAAAASLRTQETVRLVAAIMAPLAWLAAAVLHVVLWTRRSAAPVLYLAMYWLLSAVSTAIILWHHFASGSSSSHIEIYFQALSTLLAFIIAAVDSICFYDEVAKRNHDRQKSSTEALNNITYKHHDTHFYSKISFYWLNSLMYRGYKSTLEQDDLGELPDNERSRKYYQKLMKTYKNKKDFKTIEEKSPSLLHCYTRMVWPNFYIAGILKLFGDLLGVIPPLGLATIIQFIGDPSKTYDLNSQVTVQEFFNNGYVMLLIITLTLIGQAFLSQNSTHLVTVEGTRLKTALQGIVYEKCMRLAPWSSTNRGEDEKSPLLQSSDDMTVTTQSGLFTNLMSQDTYNIMSCVWICHYTWAIPLKVAVILYLLYTKLGLSAIIGSATSIFFITPLQFYIGKKISDNSKDISKCTDHRISKMTEIIQGMNVIKLYVWEDLFKEKILNQREVELKFLNKDSIYWSFLIFTTQFSTILVTVITFTLYYFLENSESLTAVNVFAGLALFNQLAVPLLILPVTVLMMIQAMISTKRIEDFLKLPESNNVREDDNDGECQQKISNKFNNDFVETIHTHDLTSEKNITSIEDIKDLESGNQITDNDVSGSTHDNQEYVVRFRNAAFSWGMKSDTLLEVDDLDIPRGKLIMVVGCTGSGKTSLLSAILGEMYLERGDVTWNKYCPMWYAGQPPWLLEGSVRDNIVMGSPWCQSKYARVLRATGLRPDLKILPEGDATHLGSHGTPLSGGQRVRVCVARSLYSNARLLALDEPLGALDAALARHVVARALVPAAHSGRTVVIATNRLELLHYADLVIAMEGGRVCAFGRAEGDSVLGRWSQLAAEARAAAARCGAGPPGGSARERSRLIKTLSRAKFQKQISEEIMVGISEAAGAYLLAEVPTCAGGSWRRPSTCPRPTLSRQFSSPPPSIHNSKWRREVRRAVSADASNTVLQREASLLRRLLRPRSHRTLTRWTPRTLRRLLSTDSDTPVEVNQINGEAEESILETTCTSVTSNGIETNTDVIANKSIASIEETDNSISDFKIWCEYARACGWYGMAYWAAATAGQALSLAADYWLTYTTAENSRTLLTDEQMWNSVRVYASWCGGSALAAGAAQAAVACAGSAARRTLHERLLHATLHAPLQHHHTTPTGATLHRFSADILVVDKKLSIAVSRWGQLVLLCGAAVVVNVVATPWTLVALLPTLFFYFILQSVYLHNARELQCAEAHSAAAVVSLAVQTAYGAGTVRAGRLQADMRRACMQRLDSSHNALLLINSANRWLGLVLDLVGAASVCATIGIALCSKSEGAKAGLIGSYSLLLPAYLAHLAKCRADLDQQLAAIERIHTDTNVPQEDYRDDFAIPSDWQRNGKIEFENVSVQHDPTTATILNNVNVKVAPGEKIAICGRSGSGKSTLLLSCVGATTICSGRVLIDGQDTVRVPLRTLRHRVVVLPQESVMFSGTLRENLDPLAVHTDEEIWHSLRAVGLYDFVTAQPAGLECTVGRARSGWGGGWSGGWAARACVARAVLRARLASALLLDEPAAALDAPAERTLLAALAAAAPNTTIITVAHRIASVRGYDHALVLEEGRTVEYGEVSALLAQPSSRFARMLATAQRLT